MQSTLSVDAPVTKTVTAWIAAGAARVGIQTWADAAAFVAMIYTICLWSEWMWKVFIRPFSERRGWIARKARRKADA